MRKKVSADIISHTIKIHNEYDTLRLPSAVSAPPKIPEGRHLESQPSCQVTMQRREDFQRCHRADYSRLQITAVVYSQWWRKYVHTLRGGVDVKCYITCKYSSQYLLLLQLRAAQEEHLI